MRLERVLEKLEELSRKWGLGINDWVFSGEYAWGLQGYKFKPREGHLDIFVDREKLPWKVGKLDATAVPPKNSEELKDLKRFIKETGFGPHFLPLPIGTFKWQTIEEVIGQSKIYTLPNKTQIRIHKVLDTVIMRANVFLKAGIRIWDEPKIRRWLEDFYQFKEWAEKKNDKEVIKRCNSVLDKYLDKYKEVERKIGLRMKEEKAPLGALQIKGTVAHKGKIEGRVKIVLNAKGLFRFQKGEVLVTPMTTPDFILIIEKAKAIVTDKGGVGCHAAVISREFRIPCIIDTKIATKILKDGDLVEVDAEKGVIKKLNKNERNRG